MVRDSIRRISITGVHKLDLVMYLAFILKSLDYQVLVCDYTQNQEIESCIRKPDKVMDLVHFQDIDFALGDLAALDETYDYRLYVQDFSDELVYQAEKYIFICDGIKANLNAFIVYIQRLQRQKQMKKSDVMILYRDMYASYGMEYVKQSCPQFIKGIVIKTLQHDCMDEAEYQRLQLYPFSHIGHVSADMEAVIRMVSEHATGVEERMLKRGIKLAKRG